MIGALKHRVTIEEPVRTSDGGGGFTEIWQSIADTPEVSASIVPVSGSEQLRFHQLGASVTHAIVIRYRNDITPAMRIVKGATVYDITAVTDRGGLGAYLEILATVKTP